MVRELIDSRLRDGIPDHWPSLCTIQTTVFGTNAANQKIPISGSDVDGMVDLPCRLGPAVVAEVPYEERRTDKSTVTYKQRTLLINKYLPSIVPYTNTCVVDGVPYLIRGMDSDSQKFMTRLRVEALV